MNALSLLVALTMGVPVTLPSGGRFAAQEPTPDPARERRWFDPVDGWLDLSAFLERPAGFLPLVVPITEPALGYGGVVGAAFLDAREEAGSAGWSRPNVTVLGGLRTEEGSEGLFAADSRLWSDGERQTLVGVGAVGLELALHGIGEDVPLENDPLDYRLDADGAVAEIRERLGESEFWGALRFAYARADVEFDGPADGIPGVAPGDEEVTLAGPALALRYDTLDNLFTPTRGWLSDTSVSFFDDSFGGSQDFQLFQQVLVHHRSLREDLFLGVRGQFNSSSGEAPFYARPFVRLRGVPALRYQGEQALSAELELRWQFHPRFSLVGFGGGGLAWTEFEQFERKQEAWGGGMGMRYLVSRKFGLHVGLDVARGPEDGAVYVQFGNAWLRP